MKLKQISEKSYIVDTISPILTATVLIYHLGNGEVVLVDTGCKASTELFGLLEDCNWHICAALCTHLHWDHIANNRQIVEYGGEIFAHKMENRENYSGRLNISYPINYVGGGKLDINGQTFVFFPTPGHTPGHSAIITPDGICHLGDALMGEAELSISKLPYMEDVQRSLVSMVSLKECGCKTYVLSHSGAVTAEKIDSLIDVNIKKEIDIYNSIRKFVSKPMKLEEFAEKFMQSLNISNPVVLANPDMRNNATKRLDELIRAGELESDGVMVFPVA